MPLDKYFGGSGKTVMASMRRTYKNPEKAKRVFYATANKRKSHSPAVAALRRLRTR